MNKILKLIVFLVCLSITAGQFYYSAVILRKKTTSKELLKVSGDGAQYIFSAKSLFDGGDHAFFRTDKANLKSNFIIDGEFDNGMYYAFRTPGYAFIYIPIRLLLSHHNTLLVILILQVLLNAMSKFILCYFAFTFANRKKIVLWITLFFTNSLYFISYFNDLFLTESFAGFFLLSSLLLAYRGQQYRSMLLYTISGIFIMIAILLRPFLLPVLGIFGLYIWVRNDFNTIKTFLSKQLLIFVLPTSLFLVGWTVRNHQKTGEVILLSKTFGWENYSNKGFKEMFYLVHNISENHEWWVNDNLTHWYTNHDSKLDILNFDRISNLPEEYVKLIHSSRKHYLKSTDTINTPIKARQEFELQAENELLKVNNYIETEHPEYKLFIPIETSYIFTSSPAITPFINSSYPVNVITVFIECYFNRTIMLLGLIGGLVLLIRKQTNKYLKVIILTQFFIITLFSLLGLNEKREVFLPCLLSMIPAGIWTEELIRNRKIIIGGIILVLVGIMSIYDLPLYINF